ncbi:MULTISPECIES: hypothetical protein [unclassified Herbaspirillum]|uniref:hypothetical protein n=1 Tax=unclassified Herbaspirillum TaxID=2624150 RepID=UPI00114EFB9B|nr:MULTISPECIES: hypothetical protein [unclassified Herbaspirillum]MBB5393029.1 hypothetical protein [Herbaspirillum sp. SJZ102]
MDSKKHIDLADEAARLTSIVIRSPRQERVLKALWEGAVSREALDQIAGCSNTPDLIAALRKKGLEIPCEIITIHDRDGKISHPGRYSLSFEDRLKVSPLVDAGVLKIGA